MRASRMKEKDKTPTGPEASRPDYVQEEDHYARRTKVDSGG
jgi:hypothetical protein